jgi:Flp pilus assembly protein TadD
MHRRRKASRQGVDLEALEAYGVRPLADALRITAEDVELLRERALVFIEAGQIERAGAVFEMLIALGAVDAATLFLSAACAKKAGQMELASARFQAALTLSRPEDQKLVEAARAWGE